MPKQPDLSGFDDVFKHLTPEQREKAEYLLLRYLELVIETADQDEKD